MAHLTFFNSLLVIYHVLKQTSTKQCIFKPYIDECGNGGLLWDCSVLNLQVVPRNIPERYRDKTLALDLSKNNFSMISAETFSDVNIKLLSDITALYLQDNKLNIITKSAFGLLENLCVLDLSNCNLKKSSLANQSFANLSKLKILRIHQNAFKQLGYPDIEISRLVTLQNLTIGAFQGFYFSNQFRKLTQLRSVNLLTENSKFNLTETTFSGLSNSPINYLELDFRNMVFCDVSEEIFCSFPVLKGVFINFGGLCDLNVALLSLRCLQHRTMDYINAYGNKPRLVEKAVFLNKENCKYLFNTCTKKVILSENRIAGVSENLLRTKMGQCMEYFDISENRIEFIKPVFMFDLLTRYPRLQVLNISLNDNHAIADNIFNHRDSYHGRDHLLLSWKRPLVTINLSKHLKVLDVSKNYIHPFVSSFPADLALSGERIKELYVVHTNFPCKFVTQLKMPSLEIIDISNNDCSEMNYKILQFATKLEKFSARNAKLNFTDTFKVEKIFIGLKRLKFADLRQNSIYYLPHTVYKDQKLSLSTLNLDNNELSTIPVSHLQKLQNLYMRFNKISFFTKTDINQLSTLHKDIKCFLEGNPISCECVHISSLKWMRKNQHKFADLNKTVCISQTISLAEFFQENKFMEFEKKCQAYLWLISSSIFSVFLLTTIFTAAFVHKYRVHVDYVILRLRSRWKGVMHVVDTKPFQFDAFVSYAEEDYQLVITTLYLELIRLGFQISLPDKDFIPGISKAEQLLQCIDDSRKVIIVVTENFLVSGWDSYAVQMVVTHAFHNNRQKSIIVIIKDGIPVERMPKDLRYIWWSIISIRWPDDGGNISFWEELSTSLNLN